MYHYIPISDRIPSEHVFLSHIGALKFLLSKISLSSVLGVPSPFNRYSYLLQTALLRREAYNMSSVAQPPSKASLYSAIYPAIEVFKF